MKKKKFNLDDMDFINSASTTDCTGLIPSCPQNESELESYFDLVQFSPKDINVNKK